MTNAESDRRPGFSTTTTPASLGYFLIRYPEAGWILLAGLAAVKVAAEHAVRVVRCLSALVEAWKARWCNVAFELGWALVD